MGEPTGGWVRWAMSPVEEREQRLAEAYRAHVERLAEAERAEADQDERLEQERQRIFGGQVGPVSVSRVDLPLSGRSFWWRSDGFWASLSAAELADRDAHPADADLVDSVEWWPWQGETAGISSEGEAAAGDRADPTWWLVWGEVYPADTVECWLADNRDVPVIRVGCVWIAEYRSRPQTVFVAVNGQVTDLPAYRPMFLPPPLYPYPESGPDPRA